MSHSHGADEPIGDPEVDPSPLAEPSANETSRSVFAPFTRALRITPQAADFIGDVVEDEPKILTDRVLVVIDRVGLGAIVLGIIALTVWGFTVDQTQGFVNLFLGLLGGTALFLLGRHILLPSLGVLSLLAAVITRLRQKERMP